jgi:hypothetical protein
MMVDPVDDIARQARQGSVSAIIQILNEKLADSGIRTRAVFDQGILQLLCEAAKPEQLEQPIVIPRVRQILESLQPRSIRRVNINSRIVREQQLLWLDEINRDPDHQLLWSEEITLRQPNLFERWMQDWKTNASESGRSDLPRTSPKRLAQEKRVFWRGLVGGASFSLFVLLLGWALYNWLQPKLTEPRQANSAVEGKTDTGNPAQQASPASASSTSGGDTQSDPFAAAVRLAEETAATGQTAQSSAEWLEVAARWQKASDLMSQIGPEDARFQDRVVVYRQNSEVALQQAQNQQGEL